MPIKSNKRKAYSSDKAKNKNYHYNNKFYSNAQIYCITFSRYSKPHKKRNSKPRSNSGSKNSSKSKSKSKDSSRPTTAPDNTKSNQRNNNKNNNFVGFKGIMNLRNNLISNNKGFKNCGDSINKKKENIMAINKNNVQNNNNIYIRNKGNMGEISQALFGNNNKRLASPVVFSNKNNKSKKQNNGRKYRLASPNYNAGINQFGNFLTPVFNGKKKNL